MKTPVPRWVRVCQRVWRRRVQLKHWVRQSYALYKTEAPRPFAGCPDWFVRFIVNEAHRVAKVVEEHAVEVPEFYGMWLMAAVFERAERRHHRHAS
jgi:hypothetical protein